MARVVIGSSLQGSPPGGCFRVGARRRLALMDNESTVLDNAVLAYDPNRTTNAQLIADVARLGHLRPDWRTWDVTYGRGAFWKDWEPDALITTDVNGPFEEDRVDFTALPAGDDSWDVVVLDPPYRLNGTPDLGEFDERYGIEQYSDWRARMWLMEDGLRECLRVAKHRVLFKCQDQVVSGKKVWQTIEFTKVAEEEGWRLVDQLHVAGYRPQPSGRTQMHARQAFSTLLIFAPEPRVRWERYS